MHYEALLDLCNASNNIYNQTNKRSSREDQHPWSQSDDLASQNIQIQNAYTTNKNDAFAIKTHGYF